MLLEHAQVLHLVLYCFTDKAAKGRWMTDENQDLRAGHSRIGRGAVRSRFFYATAAAIMGAALHPLRNWGDWKAAFGLAVLWFALLFVYDRSRLGADWKAKQRAELEYMQAFGPAPL